MKKQIFISSAIVLFLLIGTIGVVLYGRGYRFNFFGNGRPAFLGTGLLVTTSKPDGAQVFINDHLTTATNNTINLAPGEYTVRIYKEGYFPWIKKLKVQKEVVAKAEATLFPAAPALESLTAIGINNPTIDPSGTKLAYTVASQSARKNGIYVLDMSSRPILTLQSAAEQIADDTEALFSKAQLSWSPSGQELLATVSAGLRNTTYLIDATSFNESPKDVSATLGTVEQTWAAEKVEKTQAQLAAFKKPVRTLIGENFDVLAYSPDETRILYSASRSATLPIVIKPRLLGVDTTPEQRDIQQDNIYVYDVKEDKNYKLINGPLTEPLRWFPDSNHLLYVHDKKIVLLEADGSNKTTVYAGPFLDGYVFPWPDGSRIVILTNLGNPEIPANLYTIDLK